MLLVSLFSFAGMKFVNNKFKQRKTLLLFLLIQILILIIYIPWLQRASALTVGHTLKPAPNDIASTIFILLFGFLPEALLWLKWIIVLFVTIGITAASIRSNFIRTMAISFFLAPVIFCLVVSYLYRPIWLYRTLAYIVPFLDILVAFTIYELVASIRLKTVPAEVFRKSLTAGITIMFLTGTIFQELTFVYPWNIKAAAQYLQTNLKNEDIIYVPSERVLWGLCWYLVGPRSINPLRTKEVAIRQKSIRIVTKSSLENPADSQNYWLFYRSTDDIAPFAKPQLDQAASFNDLIVAHVLK
jgi:hypothetical protein